MKPPSWMRMKYIENSDGRIYVDIEFSSWHPGFWLYVVRYGLDNYELSWWEKYNPFFWVKIFYRIRTDEE